MAATRLCILSSVHPAFDARIYQKEARTLARAGFDIALIARADPTGSAEEGIELVALAPPRNRLRRMLGTLRMVGLARRYRAAVYTVHDPELLPAAVLLKLLTWKKVVYDVHEDVPAHLRTREWLPAPVRLLMPLLYRLVERLCLFFIDGIVVSEDANLRYYRKRRAVIVRNYPLAIYADLADQPKTERPTLIYAGNITALRGLFGMLELVRRLKPTFPNVLLRLVGAVGVAAEEEKARDLISEWELDDHVEWTGRVSLPEVHRQVAAADVCLALLQPDPNHLQSLPTKMFEYMMMGVPVVVTDIPLWRGIVEEAQCGYAVDVADAAEVCRLVTSLLQDEALRHKLGQSGRQAVLERYNWDAEGQTLVRFYRTLTGSA
jgi:glycosyltransferase involved in cell wall biosynthesis